MEFEGDVEFQEIGDIDWDFLFDGSNTDTTKTNTLEDVLELENPVVTAATGSSSPSTPSSTVEDAPPNPSPDWIGEIESILMKDDDGANNVDSVDYDKFLADILVDSPATATATATDTDTDVESNAFADSDKEKLDRSPLNDDDDAADPVSKKRRRQLRNKDAAVRSRERKKMYVKDLEAKAKYFEGECRRLGRLLQCCYAENHALRLSVQMKNAYRHGHGVSATKQESAVLFLELLLLGSLLGCLDIMCLFALPLILTPLFNNLELEANKALESVAPRPRGAPSKRTFQHSLLQCFSNTRRCKASRTRMKHSQFPSLLGLYESSARPCLMLAA